MEHKFIRMDEDVDVCELCGFIRDEKVQQDCPMDLYKAYPEANIRDKLKNLKKAFNELNAVWDEGLKESIEMKLCDKYPFKSSFDELSCEVADWVHSVCDINSAKPDKMLEHHADCPEGEEFCLKCGLSYENKIHSNVFYLVEMDSKKINKEDSQVLFKCIDAVKGFKVISESGVKKIKGWIG